MTHFEFRILLANNIQAAFAFHDFAIFAALLDGCFYFHIAMSILMLFISEGDSSFGQIIRRHFDLDFVTGQDLYVVHAHLARDMGDNHVAVVQLHAEHGVGQGFDDGTILFY